MSVGVEMIIGWLVYDGKHWHHLRSGDKMGFNTQGATHEVYEYELNDGKATLKEMYMVPQGTCIKVPLRACHFDFPILLREIEEAACL
jgi:hypothetical protein